MTREDEERDQSPESGTNDPPVDGPGGAEDNDDAGGTSYDEPGGDEHGS